MVMSMSQNAVSFRSTAQSAGFRGKSNSRHEVCIGAEPEKAGLAESTRMAETRRI